MSRYVTTIVDVVQIYRTLSVFIPSVSVPVRNIAKFAHEHTSCLTLAFTHLQQVQPNTSGEYVALLAKRILYDEHTLKEVLNHLRLRVVEGTTKSHPHD